MEESGHISWIMTFLVLIRYIAVLIKIFFFVKPMSFMSEMTETSCLRVSYLRISFLDQIKKILSQAFRLE